MGNLASIVSLGSIAALQAHGIASLAQVRSDAQPAVMLSRVTCETSWCCSAFDL